MPCACIAPSLPIIFLHLESHNGDGEEEGNILDDSDSIGDLETLLWPPELLHQPQKMASLENRLESHDQEGERGSMSASIKRCHGRAVANAILPPCDTRRVGRTVGQWCQQARATQKLCWPCRAGLSATTLACEQERGACEHGAWSLWA